MSYLKEGFGFGRAASRGCTIGVEIGWFTIFNIFFKVIIATKLFSSFSTNNQMIEGKLLPKDG